MITTTEVDQLSGAKVLDSDGDRVGTVGQVYVDDTTGDPLFATVKTGLFGTSESFVPLANADFDGNDLKVAYDKAMIKDAPKTEADGELNEDEQDRLFDYYGITSGATLDPSAPTDIVDSADYNPADDSTAGYKAADSNATKGQYFDDTPAADTSTDGPAAGGTPVTPRDSAVGTYVDTTEGRDTSGPTTDDAMTRSEEQLKVGVQKIETGRAKLRKRIVTEQQTVTVPVTHDEVRIEREPITDGNIGNATSGPALSEEEHEIVLTEERPVVTKDTVAVERVRLATDQVTEQQDVTEDVSHEVIEQIDADGTVRN